MKKIAIYGKGGIGKSTTVSNVAAALSSMGLTVMQIGCDPKADSTRNLTEGKNITTVLDALRENSDANLDELVVKSSTGVLCVESGGPIPGVGCAGRGIITAFEKLEELEAYDIYKPDIVLYDVLGDVVCGGFTMPIRGGYADEVCVVTSGEMMSLYAATNISRAVKSFGSRGYASIRGLILNAKNIEGENKLVDDVAKEIDVPVIYRLPRNPYVQQAEDQGKTVVEAYPDSEMAKHYMKLAKLLAEGGKCIE
ncbi:nitrogenase iron protein NifH [Clostridioides mangenotii]|uniref:nucleotide-binding protein n=1 Tax=Metaclostridioides mangenotii TaxID=1540 RepID=UPI001C0FE4DB|nr:nitrogenase iron protein NifH [Clostridioides mangenotii]MBU5307508.1 AAA family ATPase [Clostridioides mangenotii]MCR1953220.1 nitrogenase iron protein NifH [Clostridioides mangenotii]